jgi:hypothetical protein
MMISKRDILIAVVSCCATFGVVTAVQQKQQLMSSSVFDWDTIPAKETKTGSTRASFVRRQQLSISSNATSPRSKPAKHLMRHIVIPKKS